MVDNGPDLTLGDEGALNSHGLVRAHREKQPIALPYELLCPGLIKDDPAVGEARCRERQAARNIRLDETGYDVNAWALSGEHKMDAGRSRKLRDAHNRLFNVTRRDHHEICKLIDDDQEIRVRTHDALAPRRGSE